MGTGVVGLDLGPSTIAIVADKEAKLLQFCAEIEPKQKEIKALQRKIERQRRAMNPQNYSPLTNKVLNGKRKWLKSEKQKLEQSCLQELQRATAEHRKTLHGTMVNDILRMGNIFKFEKLSYKSFQRNYGKSVSNRAPGMFISMLTRKAESAGGLIMEFSTYTTKLSQTCQCGKVVKKELSQRVHDCGCGVHVQRDLYSAYLAKFVEEKKSKDKSEYILQANQALDAWLSAEPLLQTAWSNSNQSMNGRTIPITFGKFSTSQSQNGSSVTEKTVKFEVLDVVTNEQRVSESQKENTMIPLRTPWL